MSLLINFWEPILVQSDPKMTTFFETRRDPVLVRVTPIWFILICFRVIQNRVMTPFGVIQNRFVDPIFSEPKMGHT